MGTERTFATPSCFAQCLLEFMNNETQKGLYVHAKVNESTGSIWFCSVEYYETCKHDGWWRCHECGAFASDERALWWHQKTKHDLTHSDAMKEVEAERNALSVILNGSLVRIAPGVGGDCSSSGGKLQQKKRKDPDDLQKAIRAAKGGDLGEEFEKCIIEKKIVRLPFQSLEYSRRGDIDALRKCTEDVKNCLDSNGASCLHWACGSDSLQVVQYLIEELNFDPNQPQKGKRSYEGRTPLHWAARNGNIRVCKYLLETCKVDVNCKTNDGTSAFAWATWKGEIDVMKLLIRFGANARESANQFGCNAAMWACQSDGDNVDVCEYLRSLNVTFRLVNANGHSALHKAAQRGNERVVDWIIENSRRLGLSYSLHCRKDLEGFRPSDLAKMEDKEFLCTKIERFQRRLQFEEEEEEEEEEERVEHEKRNEKDDDAIKRHRVRYPPTSFYAAVSTGRLDLFRNIIDVDPYYASQDNGAGSPLHFAASYGEPDMISELLEYGGLVNQRDLFGMTPLHRAATLMQKYVVGAAIQEEYDDLVKKLAEIKEFRRSADEERNENKSELKRLNKAAWKRDSQRAKDIETMFEKPSQLLGTKNALQTYRTLLALGADPSSRDDILKLTPRELAKRDINTNFASEITDAEVNRRIEALINQLEHETKEAPTSSKTGGYGNTNRGAFKNWHALRKRTKRVAAQNAEDIRDSFWHAYYAERNRAIEVRCLNDHKSFSVGKEIPVARYDVEEEDRVIEESEAVSALRSFDDTEAVRKEAIDGVPGAFLLRNVFTKSNAQILAKYVNQIQPNKYNQTNARRESMAEKIMRTNLEILNSADEYFTANEESVKSVLKGFKILAVDPIIALSSTDTFYGESRLPVEPVSWLPMNNENNKNTAVLEAMAKRIREYLPLRSGMDGKSGRYLVDDDNLLLDERLRCYRYSEKTCSIPHYDKSTTAKEKEMCSAYSLIVYLNGTAHLGGETGFFLDSQPNSRKSNSGLTKNCGDGNFPLVEYVASVKGETGDILLFPHGNKEVDKDYEHLLHDGREVLAGESKFLIRTDVMYYR